MFFNLLCCSEELVQRQHGCKGSCSCQKNQVGITCFLWSTSLYQVYFQFMEKGFNYFMIKVCIWILCAHVYLISLDGGLLLLLLLPYGVVLLLKFLQLFLADLLGENRKNKCLVLITCITHVKNYTNNSNYTHDEK